LTAYVLATVFAYLIGGLPFGYLFVRFTLGKDVRTMGSGNIGATNVHRTTGLKAGLTVLLLDIGKGFLAVALGAWLTHSDPVGLALAAAAVMLGHCYPLFLGFKGGKAVACFIGAFLYIAPLSLLVVLIVFVITVVISPHVSMGSIVGALSFPIVIWLIQHPPLPILFCAIFAALLIVYRHKANIARLRAGTESVFSFKGSSKGPRK
jgi:acyl phosphate:glycerol-3-phosphate acyltransferase